MMRALTTLLGCILLAGLPTAVISTSAVQPKAAEEADWPLFRGNALQTGGMCITCMQFVRRAGRR